MGKILNSIRKIFTRSASASSPVGDTTTVWPWSEGISGTATNVAAVYQCVNVICKNVARLPLRTLKRSGSGVFTDAGVPWLDWLLTISPNERQSSYDFLSQLVWQLKLQGNAVIIPMWGDPLFAGGPRMIRDLERLILCSPYSVTLDTVNRIYRVNDSVTGVKGDFYPSEVIHIKEPSHDGQWGVSPVTRARTTIDTALAGDKETRERFRNGGNVKGFISNAPLGVTGFNNYSKEALEKSAKEKEDFFRQGGNITYLTGTATFHQLMMTSADMQFLQSRQFTVVEICRWFGVSPSFVFAGTSSNYKESQKVRSDFVTDTLEPLLTQIEKEFNRKLLGFSGTRDYRVSFDRSGLASSDPEAAVKLTAARVAAGLDTLNEARKAYGREPVEGGDTVLMSANLKSMSALMNEGEATNDTKTDNDDEK